MHKADFYYCKLNKESGCKKLKLNEKTEGTILRRPHETKVTFQDM